MLKNKFKIILIIMITIAITGCVSAYATYNYFAKNVGYTPSDKNFNVDNVEDALNYLFEKSNNSYNLEFIVDQINGREKTIENGLIPKLTSNTGTNGEAFCNTPLYTVNYDAWKAFNQDLTGNDCQNWVSYVMNEENYGYIGYKFNTKQSVNAFYVNTLKTDGNVGVNMNNFVLQACNDGESWVDLTETISHPVQTCKFYVVTKNQGDYFYYRLYGSSQGAYSLVGLHELQLFNF